MPEEVPSKSNATISFTKEEVSNGRINENLVPKSILITVTSKKNDETVYNLEKLPVYELGDGYITEELELFVGQYEVTDFIVLNEADEAIYLTPKQDSEFASLVTTPLPHPFLVNASETSEVELEVIRADLGEPVDYGYTVFTFDVVNTLEVGLIAHYKFDGNLSDSGPNEIDLGPIYENPDIVYLSDRNEDENKAIYFDGTFGVIAYGDDYETGLYNQSEPQTMSFWMKTNDPNSQTEFGGGMVRIETVAESRFYTSIKHSQIQLNYGETHVYPYGNLFLLDTLQSDNAWRHIVYISYGNGTHGKLYINGIRISGELDFTIPNDNTANPNINIGGKIPENFYIGALDDVRLYNHALTEREVLELFLE